MPADFPNSPQVNDVYQIGPIIYVWNGSAWKVQNTSAGTSGYSGYSGAGVSGFSGYSGADGPSEDLLSIFIDSTPDEISTGNKGYRLIPYSCQPLEWYLIAGQSGSIQFDIKKSSFANYPATISMVGADYPILNGQLQNSNTNITDWENLDAGDMIDFVINSNSGIQNVGLFVKIRRNS